MVYDDPEFYKHTPLKKLEKANFALYVNIDGTIEIIKNRYSGVIGSIHNKTGVKILVQLLIGTAYNNTCEIFQEALRQDIYKVLENHKVLEGEENERIKFFYNNKPI